MKPKLQYGLMALCAILVIGLVFIGIQQKNQSESLERKIESNPKPTKETKQVSMTPAEVKTAKQRVEGKIDEFLDGKYGDDNIFEDDTAGNVFYKLFTASGLKGIDENSSEKEVKERYKYFDYELENVTAQKSVDEEIELNANIKVKVDDKDIDTGYDLFSVTIDSTGDLKGGTLYAKQSNK